ncbi:MAG: glycosyltransferase, partial [Dinghuibacter sp.]|nr:glycosyltransferase [Dinghuibacter sp.]
MSDHNPYILMLAGWYPHTDDPFNGDFVQRHARSIALYRKVIVVFAVKTSRVKKLTVTQSESCNGNLLEYIIYYPERKWLGRIFSLLHFQQHFLTLFRQIKQEHGLPELVHVNIVWKACLWALFLKRRYGLRYVITENWTGYYRADPENFYSKSHYIQKMIRRTFQRAECFLPVTADLGQRCTELFGRLHIHVVENAVDTRLFYYAPAAHERKRLVHVSSMGYQKHTEAIIAAVNELAQSRGDFELLLVGPAGEAIKNCLSEHPYAARVTKTTGNIPYNEVAGYVRHADMMVLFSRYENLPCVILEALCCGVPVLATDVGGIREVITPENGVLVASGNEAALQQQLDIMLNQLHRYNRDQIAQDARTRFSYEAIGQKYLEVY